MNRSSDAIEQTADILGKAEDRIDGVSEDLSVPLSSAAIYTSLLRRLADGSSLNTDEISRFISSPVNVENGKPLPRKELRNGDDPVLYEPGTLGQRHCFNIGLEDGS